MLGRITEIQRFCLNDGPGIRTTVFFKGCNMRCAWCHNPEAIAREFELHFYQNKCIGCAKCVQVCLVGAQIIREEKHYIDRELCTRCGKCAEICYAQALVIAGRIIDVDEVISEILQDKEYYLNSGGGVTLSGGEIFCQDEFVAAIIEECHKNDIKVAVETNLHHPFHQIEKLIKNLDLIMLDIKLFDNAEHKKWTGVENRVILDNVKKVDALGIPMIVRTPLIPGITDTETNLKSIAAFNKQIKNLLYYELLNFNPLGESKYKSLDRKNPFEKTRSLSQKRLREIYNILSDTGLTIKIS